MPLADTGALVQVGQEMQPPPRHPPRNRPRRLSTHTVRSGSRSRMKRSRAT